MNDMWIFKTVISSKGAKLCFSETPMQIIKNERGQSLRGYRSQKQKHKEVL